ncbi:MAG: hypothetical protein GX787_04255, partial [Tissierellia bacterium]|nr:hypothetical protein [Tissierellia bacterium]
MLMTMFVGVGTASAAIVDYSAYGVPTVQTENKFNKTLGSIVVDIDDVVYLGVYENWVTLKMPSGVSVKDGSVKIEDVRGNIEAKAFYKNSSTVDIMVKRNDSATHPAGDPPGDPRFVITFNEVKVQSGSGNLDVTFIPQSGSILPGGTVTIANIVSKGATQATITTVKSLPAGGGAIDTIAIGELSPGVFKNTNFSQSSPGIIKIELPAGVTWRTGNKHPDPTVAALLNSIGVDGVDGLVVGSWAFDALNTTTTVSGKNIISLSTVEVKVSDNDSILEISIYGSLDGNNKAGRLDIAALSIYIDEDDAKKGDIVAKISSKNIDGLTKQDLTIAKYGDFETKVIENEVTELIAGQTDQELGSFYIEESLARSLVAGRNINLQLPSGVKWTDKPVLTAEKGSIDADVELVNDKRARITINNFSEDAGKILVEEGEVYVEPNFEGDVVLEVSGTAGVKGEVKVAEAVKAVEVTVSEVPNIIIGEQNVKAGDIIIKENAAEAIQKGDIVIELAGGYVFYKEPTVKVTEGDLRIDDVDINNDDQLVITIDKESNDASTITISDIYIVGYRYAPTGPVVAKFVAAEGYQEIISKDEKDVKGSTALDSFYIAPNKTQDKDNKYSEKSVGEVIIANCITPAEAAATAEFKIGSNIFYVNGIAKVMDVAPYIK